MPRKITMLGVFASCPSDLAAELTVLDNVIRELNPRLRDAFSVELRLITAANSVVPGIGLDPQAVINDQVSDEYDVYIGLLGTRFGTPTPRAGSGTEEEFRGARDRWLKSPDTVRILFYFKGMPDVSVQNLDLQQLAKVQEFRKSISAQLFYCDFKATEDFLPLVRDHLWKLVSNEWTGSQWKRSDATAGTSVNEMRVGKKSSTLDLVPARNSELLLGLTGEADEEDGVGALDAIVEAQDSVQAGMAALDRITSITAQQTEKFNQHAKVITYFTANSQNPRELKLVVDAAADDLAEYARSLRREIPAFLSSFSSGFNALDVAVSIWLKAKPPKDQLLQLRQTLETSIAGMRSGSEPVTAFRNVIASIPSLTSRLKKAVRATRIQLDDLIAGLTIISDRATATVGALLQSEAPGTPETATQADLQQRTNPGTVT